MTKNQLIPILVVAANPLDTPPLRLDEEVREIDEGLRRAAQRDRFAFHQRWATRAKDLRRAMLDVSPSIVHFSGHGTTEGLAFEGPDGRARIVNPEALADLFRLFSGKVNCVLLNACYSAPQAEAISKHIDYVIGMSTEIGDEAAIEFAVGFYDALGAGRSFEDAYSFGCNALRLEGIPEHLTPVLHSRSRPTDSEAAPPAAHQAARPAGGGNTDPIGIFYSYSHRDEKMRDRIETHLSLLRREGVIKSWHDRKISPSREWEGEIDAHLSSAQIILLLVSANFLASDYIYDIEMTRAMERHERGEARVIPIILSPCDWSGAPFSKLHALPRDAKPITTWSNRDQALVEIAKGIRAVVKELSAN